jgi:hypothetical protein
MCTPYHFTRCMSGYACGEECIPFTQLCDKDPVVGDRFEAKGACDVKCACPTDWLVGR